MNYRIKIYTHKLKATISDDITKLVEYFNKHGIILDLSIEETLVPKQDVPLKLFTPNDGKCDVVMYIYDKASFNMQSQGLAFNYSPTLRAIYLATTTWDDAVDYTWKSMAHEIMHTLFYKFNINHLDPMDIMKVGNTWKPYYKNEELNAPDGNFAEAFKRLAPYIKPAVIITRVMYDDIQVLGKLTYGSFTCRTLERPNKDNKPNISCIPKGTYKCKFTFSPKFMKYTYQIMNVPKRSGIRIHSGNYFFDIEGCILLGSGFKDINGDGKFDVINSRNVIRSFESLLNKKDFTLIIK